MQPTPNEMPLSEEKRREIFLALVATQDEDVDVPQSRSMVGQKFGITTQDVRRIEREGLDGKWPPLADCA